jgi:gamma-glutamylcyclotransferase (GGCT)/AIG2-like uncharacterized protein YtfP
MYLFVYGVMRKNCINHSFIKDCKYIGLFKTEKLFQLIKYQNFPYASDIKFFENEDFSSIIGEVYEIDDITFSKINTFTGYPNHYNCKLINATEINNNSKINAYIYLLSNEDIINDIKKYQGSKYEIIKSGNFLY